ncbi:hypothetical protein ACMGDM_19075 [Sphingomonas sp. DT-51]|uniref:hypothetical protein n=1 Tax=Sphingomonas sp. DT-51 TaxID=3396165 RepID=UPI003F1AE5B9
MVGPIGSRRLDGVGAIRIGGPGVGSRAGTAMRTLAGRIGDAFAREFDLLDEDRRRRHEGDPYDVDGTARELTHELGGGPVDQGLLARSLGAFVLESASLVGARPEASSLEKIDGAIARAEAEEREAESIDTALRSIDRTTAIVSERR